MCITVSHVDPAPQINGQRLTGQEVKYVKNDRGPISHGPHSLCDVLLRGRRANEFGPAVKIVAVFVDGATVYPFEVACHDGTILVLLV